MNWLSLGPSTLLLILLLGWIPLAAQQPVPQPTAARLVDANLRRDSIHKELDANEKAVKEFYQLLDATPETEVAARSFLDTQIHLFDDRNGVLFEQLDALDRHDFEQNRRHELKLQADRLEEETKQLRNSGHILPATLREAKAKSIRKSLGDGTWKLLVDQEWNCQDGPEKQQERELLSVVQKLNAETAALRQEVKLLRELVEKLMTQKHLSKQR